jgi:hypothetical protein
MGSRFRPASARPRKEWRAGRAHGIDWEVADVGTSVVQARGSPDAARGRTKGCLAPVPPISNMSHPSSRASPMPFSTFAMDQEILACPRINQLTGPDSTIRSRQSPYYERDALRLLEVRFTAMDRSQVSAVEAEARTGLAADGLTRTTARVGALREQVWGCRGHVVQRPPQARRRDDVRMNRRSSRATSFVGRDGRTCGHSNCKPSGHGRSPLARGWSAGRRAAGRRATHKDLMMTTIASDRPETSADLQPADLEELLPKKASRHEPIVFFARGDGESPDAGPRTGIGT